MLALGVVVIGVVCGVCYVDEDTVVLLVLML